MRKIILSLILLVAMVFSAFAGLDNLSIQLDSDVYRIISVAEIRGIIPAQSDVKPYNLSLVRSLLNEISASELTSNAEKSAIETILYELNRSYGGSKPKQVKNVIKNGYINVIDTDYAKLNIGAKLMTKETFSFSGAFDSRNKMLFYLTGDVLSKLSFNMNLGLLIDKLDHNAFLLTDFTSENEGVYMHIFGGGGGAVDESPFTNPAIGTGWQMAPEVGTSLWDGKFTARFASIKRDWGPGSNNIGLSGSARSFDAVEFQFAPSSKFRFSVLVGSLGDSYVQIKGEAPALSDKFHENKYDNNFSLQRVELNLFKRFRFSIYESVIWRKRAELAYWNPFTVYMFAQNALGDFDNVLAGIDTSYTIKNVGKLYFAFAFDEIHELSLKRLLTAARNIIALQGGAEFNIPWASFGKLTLQVTYIPPFFGTHYPTQVQSINECKCGECRSEECKCKECKCKESENKIYPNDIYASAYVNKGQPLSYPLNPDSIEFLLKYETTLPYGISLAFIAKDQMRSAQYSTDSYDVKGKGTGFNDYMRYSLDYEDKDFFNYIWNNIVDLEITGRKTMRNFPLTIKVGLQCIIDSRRDYILSKDDVKNYPPSGAADNENTYNEADQKFNLGNGTTMGNNWNTTTRFCCSIGVEIFY